MPEHSLCPVCRHRFGRRPAVGRVRHRRRRCHRAGPDLSGGFFSAPRDGHKSGGPVATDRIRSDVGVLSPTTTSTCPPPCSLPQRCSLEAGSVRWWRTVSRDRTCGSRSACSWSCLACTSWLEPSDASGGSDRDDSFTQEATRSHGADVQAICDARGRGFSARVPSAAGRATVQSPPDRESRR
jgi:hypothetical protein